MSIVHTIDANKKGQTIIEGNKKKHDTETSVEIYEKGNKIKGI